MITGLFCFHSSETFFSQQALQELQNHMQRNFFYMENVIIFKRKILLHNTGYDFIVLFFSHFVDNLHFRENTNQTS